MSLTHLVLDGPLAVLSLVRPCGNRVEYMLLLRWTEEASQKAMDSALAERRGLQGTIAGVVDLAYGANCSALAQGDTHGRVVRLPDRAALAAYGPHPEHERLVQNCISPMRAEMLALDDAC